MNFSARAKNTEKFNIELFGAGKKHEKFNIELFGFWGGAPPEFNFEPRARGQTEDMTTRTYRTTIYNDLPHTPH